MGSGRPGNAKSNAVVRPCRVVLASLGGPQAHWAVEPRTAANHTLRTVALFRRGFVVRPMPAVRRPLPDIPHHVVKAIRVRSISPYRGRDHMTVGTLYARPLGEPGTSRPDRRRWRSRTGLRAGRPPNSVRWSCHPGRHIPTRPPSGAGKADRSAQRAIGCRPTHRRRTRRRPASPRLGLLRGSVDPARMRSHRRQNWCPVRLPHDSPRYQPSRHIPCPRRKRRTPPP